MNKHTYLLLGLMLLVFQTACDKVVEKPMEEQFPKIELKEINQPTDSTGTAFLDVVTENGIVETVNVSFSSPSKGKIEPDPQHHRFIYKAFPEQSGVDSFSYTISRQAHTKTGMIKLQVITLPCVPNPSGDIDYSIGNQVLDSILFIPFDARDKYCKNLTVSMADDAPLFRVVRVVENGFFIEATRVLVSGGNFSVNYLVHHKDFNPISKLVKFNLNFSSNYCDKVFKVRNLPFPIRVHGPNNGYIFLDRKMFVNQVQSCSNEVVMVNNWFVPVEQIQFAYELDSTRVKLFRPSGPGTKEIKFGFRFKNSRGMIGTGYGTAKF